MYVLLLLAFKIKKNSLNDWFTCHKTYHEPFILICIEEKKKNIGIEFFLLGSNKKNVNNNYETKNYINSMQTCQGFDWFVCTIDNRSHLEGLGN
jgi:hypothetical protein